tara:strand:+ start:89 stop:553 length:465 start_codon:yes stop_codon:yes gene_type:complete
MVKVVYDDGVGLVNEIIEKLKNIHEDENGKFYYGGHRLPLYSGENAELECLENNNLIKEYLPRIKKVFKEHTNWSNMNKSQKFVSNHLSFLLKSLYKKPLPSKTIRFPKFKSYLVKKYYISSNNSSKSSIDPIDIVEPKEPISVVSLLNSSSSC